MSFADPLWEFVLEDYEDGESIRRDRGRKATSKSTNGRKGFFGGSKRGNSTEYRDDEEDGFWDVITGAPPKATIKRSQSFSGRQSRSLLAKKSAPKTTTRSSSLTRSQSSVSESGEKKKNRFKNRFSRKKNSDDASMKEYSAKKVDVKHTTLAADRDDARTSSAGESYDSSFDPLDLIYHIADTFDPLAIEPSEASTSDAESHDGTATLDDYDDGFAEESILSIGLPEPSESRSRSPSRSSSQGRNKKGASLLDQQLANQRSFDPNRYPYHSKQPGSGEKTEIRLRVNPGGNTLSEEVFNPNVIRNREEDEESYPMDEPDIPIHAASFDSDAWKANRDFDSEFGTRKPASEEMRSPTNFPVREGAEAGKRDGGDGEAGIAKSSSKMKRAVCGLKKVGSSEKKKSDAAEVLPSSRGAIDGEFDPMDGMLGMNPLIGSKGPQQVFAYDYDSNMNMDVCYREPNQNPRTSISVRKLGAAPPLSPLSSTENIVVQVQASLVSETDCIVRQGLWWRNSKPSFPTTPGIVMVGKVYGTNQTTGKAFALKSMETVTSLVKWGGNARFMTIHPNQLVKVPAGLSPVQVACLPECYLSAFQVLHMGQTGNGRYRESSMKGKSILILGCMTNNMGKAIIELALHAGVANIYATAKKKHWKTLVSYGVMPLSTNPMEYMPRIAGTMDLVIAPNGNLREDVTPVHFRALLPKYGQLVMAGHRILGNDIPIDDWKKNHRASALACGKNKALQKILRNSISYDVYEMWEKNLELCKRDLSHLLKLLESKSIKPEVLDRIPLNKVAKAHELLETKRLPGFLVCEPWIKTKKRALYL